MPELAISSIMSLYSLNYNTKNKAMYTTLNLLNGMFTYATGYTYFLRDSPSSGVYVFLLGLTCIAAASGEFLFQVAQEWDSRFRIVTPQKKVLSFSEDEDSTGETTEEETFQEEEDTPQEEESIQEESTQTFVDSPEPISEVDHPKTE